MSAAAKAVSHAEIRNGLSRILASADFDTSERNRRFLSYIVTETLAGRADRIKAYTIATSVFGRDHTFDPQVDSIVRIEAGRLRRSLERYYLTSGAADPVRITIPRGSYVPDFAYARSATPAPQATPPAPATAAGKLRLFVTAFEMEGDAQLLPNFSRGLTRQIIAGLTRFQTIAVYCSGPAIGGEGPAGAGAPERGAFDLVLSGGTSLTDHRMGIEALLTDTRDGRLIWAETFDRDVTLASAMDQREEVAATIVRTLAQPYGVLFASQLSRAAETLPRGAALEAVAMYHVFKRTFDLEMYDTLRLALEDAIARDPADAEAFACLSHVYCAPLRFRLPLRAPYLNPVQRALALAQRAIELAPRMSAGFQARATALWFMQDVEGSLESLHTALRLNPQDTEMMAELGQRLAMRMDWDAAIPLLDEAYARNPALPGTYRVGYALWHLAHDRFAEARYETLRINAPRVVYQHILAAIAANAADDPAAVEAALRAMDEVDPGYAAQAGRDLAARNLHPDLTERVLSGLAAARCKGRPARGLRRSGVVQRPSAQGDTYVT
jgi:TolB-like protein